MLAIGFGLAWFAYGNAVYAALLITGKNVSYKQVWSLTTWPPKSTGIACGKPTGATSTPGQPTNAPAGTVVPTPTGQQTTAQQLTGGV